MKLVDVLLLALAVVFLFIGVYETIIVGFGTGYWGIMVALCFFFYFVYRKKK